MKTCHLTFISKNEKSLNKAFLFFKHLNYYTIKTFFLKKRKKQFFTLLKSPHINKKAQEQFEFRTFSRQLTVRAPKNIKFIFFLKKVTKNLFSDVKLKIKFTINKKREKDLRIDIFNPNHFILNINNLTVNNNSLLKLQNFKYNNFNISYNKKIKSFLQILDIYGELSIYV